jgi:hypothetical protein
MAGTDTKQHETNLERLTKLVTGENFVGARLVPARFGFVKHGQGQALPLQFIPVLLVALSTASCGFVVHAFVYL